MLHFLRAKKAVTLWCINCHKADKREKAGLCRQKKDVSGQSRPWCPLPPPWVTERCPRSCPAPRGLTMDQEKLIRQRSC